MILSTVNMTPSQQAKDSGLKSLKQMAELTGVKVRTLINWHKDKPVLFKIILVGLSNLNKEQNND